MPFPTREERLSRIRTAFNSKLSLKNGRSVASSEAPLVYGLALRALQRKAQGLELSRLETSIASLWSRFIHDDDELAEHSKLFTDPEIAQSVPDTLTKLDIQSPYSLDDLSRDLGQSRSVDGANSNLVKIVDLGSSGVNALSAAPEGDDDTLVSIITSSAAPADNSVQESVDGRRTIFMEKFTCMKMGSDSIFTPANETYWAYSAAVYNTTGQKSVTKVYKDVDTGETFTMNVDLWSGNVGPKTVVSLHLECWEEDDSGRGWIDDLKGAMWDVAEILLDSAAEAAKNKDGVKAAAVLAILAGVSALIAGIIEFFRNDDDLVKERCIMIDHAGLQALWNDRYKDDWWGFDGQSHNDGYFRLFLRLK